MDYIMTIIIKIKYLSSLIALFVWNLLFNFSLLLEFQSVCIIIIQNVLKIGLEVQIKQILSDYLSFKEYKESVHFVIKLLNWKNLENFINNSKKYM